MKMVGKTIILDEFSWSPSRKRKRNSTFNKSVIPSNLNSSMDSIFSYVEDPFKDIPMKELFDEDDDSHKVLSMASAQQGSFNGTDERMSAEYLLFHFDDYSDITEICNNIKLDDSDSMNDSVSLLSDTSLEMVCSNPASPSIDCNVIRSDLMWSSTSVESRPDFLLSENLIGVDISGTTPPSHFSEDVVPPCANEIGCCKEEETHEDVEVDVVTVEENSLTSMPQIQTPIVIEPGCSLLLSNTRNVMPARVLSNHSLLDHCYFQPTTNLTTMKGLSATPRGLLTPTESSDDDALSSFSSQSSSSSVDKEKIAQALKLLMKSQPPVTASTSTDLDPTVKFKFRLKLTPNTSEKSRGVRTLGKKYEGAKKQHKKINFPITSAKGKSQKCREIRDLHNSLERQRRVDLRRNFEALKSVVPDVMNNEKASKLNILNTAAAYCQLLTNMERRLRTQLVAEKEKRSMLTQKLKASFKNSEFNI